MLATRRSVATALVGIASTSLMLFHPATVGGPTRVAIADENVRIESPADGASVTGLIDIRVTATAADPSQVDFYRIYVGNGRSSVAMRPVGPPHTTPVVNEVLATLDTGLLLAGEATIQLRLYPKSGDVIETSVVVVVEGGPPETLTFTGPVVMVPPVGLAPFRPELTSGPAGVEFPIDALPVVEIPEVAPIERTLAPITRLTQSIVDDTLPGDPIQDDPILRDLPTIR